MAKATKTNDLFEDLPVAPKPKNTAPARSRGEDSYTAADIEVLELSLIHI